MNPNYYYSNSDSQCKQRSEGRKSQNNYKWLYLDCIVPFTNISNFYAKQIVFTVNRFMAFTNVAIQKITTGLYCESLNDFYKCCCTKDYTWFVL